MPYLGHLHIGSCICSVSTLALHCSCARACCTQPVKIYRKVNGRLQLDGAELCTNWRQLLGSVTLTLNTGSTQFNVQP